MKAWTAAVLVVGLGCAASTPREEETMRPDRPALTASQIYAVGEARYDAGRYGEAVSLWRHALEALPSGADGDKLRHQLILRMAYAHLMGWSTGEGDTVLVGAQTMLYAYLEYHEQRFGAVERAQRERGAVYELLYQVESRLPGEGDDEGDDERDPHEDAEDARTSETHATVDPPTEIDPHGVNVRKIRVRRDRPSVDDPVMRAKLVSDYGNPEDGYVLAAPDTVPLYGPRALVRGGPARAETTRPNVADRKRARRLGRALVQAARPGLTRCYEQALARDPLPVAKSVVSLQVDPQGRVTDAVIVGGGLVDALGDLCVLDHLHDTTVAEVSPTPNPTRIELPLRFMVEEAVVINEFTARSWPAGGIVLSGDVQAPDPARPAGGG